MFESFAFHSRDFYCQHISGVYHRFSPWIQPEFVDNNRLLSKLHRYMILITDFRIFGTVFLILFILGFMIIFAKLSDIYGRKVVILTAILIFIVGSGACGAAQTITQLRVIIVLSNK